MKNTQLHKAKILMIAGLCLVAWQIQAEPVRLMKPSTMPANAQNLTQSYVWHDGKQEYTVWLNPQVVAEFNPNKSGAKAVAKADAGAKELPLKRPQAGIRLWQVSNSGNSVVTGVATSYPGSKLSPVFHSGPDSGSSMRALPGNIIVQLDPAWNKSEVDAWVKKRNMQVVKKLNIGSNFLLLKTGPGLEALEVANALRLSGEVKAAYPDWWQEATTR